jgi:hypothetical protein
VLYLSAHRHSENEVSGIRESLSTVDTCPFGDQPTSAAGRLVILEHGLLLGELFESYECVDYRHNEKTLKFVSLDLKVETHLTR